MNGDPKRVTGGFLHQSGGLRHFAVFELAVFSMETPKGAKTASATHQICHLRILQSFSEHWYIICYESTPQTRIISLPAVASR